MKKNSIANYVQALYQVSTLVNEPHSAEVVRSLVAALKRKNALAKLPKILAQFQKYASKKDGVVDMKITSAHPLTNETKDAITASFGGQTNITENLDSNLIGGLVIKTDDTIFDASIKNQLVQLKNQLSN